MEYYKLKFEARAVISSLVGGVVFYLGLLYGPINTPGRAVVGAAFAGGISAALAGFSVPGWPIFSAALAFIGGGWYLNRTPGAEWTYQAILVMYAAAAWVAAWPIGQYAVQAVFGIPMQKTQPFLPPNLSTRSRLTYSLLSSLLLTASLTIINLLCFPLMPLLALPASILLAIWSSYPFPRTSLFCNVAGGLTSLPLAFVLPDLVKQMYNHLAPSLGKPLMVVTQSPPALAPNAARYPFDLIYLPPAPPWLLGGMIISGIVIAHWLLQWYKMDNHKKNKPHTIASPSVPRTQAS